MNLRYKILFNVELRHDYYSDMRCEDFEIVPSMVTKSALKGLGMLFKVIANRLIVLIKVGDSDKPVVTPDSSQKFTFFMRLKNRRFINFTNIGYHPSEGKRYYFSNINQTKVVTALYLNSKVPVYNSSAEYPIGVLAANGSDTVFEAIKPSNSAAPHALTEQDYWLNRGKIQYVNSNDMVEVSSYLYLFNAIANTNFTINVFGLSITSGNYDLAVMDTVNLSYTDPQTSVPVRLENLPKGKYKIDVNSEVKYIYLDSDAVYDNIFGIIEVFNHLPPGNAFALFSASGKSKEPLFLINFANRALIWKYVAKSSDVTAVNDSRPLPDKVVFTSAGANQFVSAKPVLVGESAINTLSIESTALGTVSPIGNPSPDRLALIEMNGNSYYSAELHLNY